MYLFFWLFSPLLMATSPDSLARDPSFSPLQIQSIQGSFQPQKSSSGEGLYFHLDLKLKLQKGFWAYQDRFQLHILPPLQGPAEKLSLHPIVEFKEGFSQKRKKGIYGSARLQAPIEWPKDLKEWPPHLEARLTYVACTDRFCLTPRSLKIRTSLPQPLERKESSLPALPSSSSSLQDSWDKNRMGVLLLFFFLGFLTSLTPCVYPLIPITLAVLGGSKTQKPWTSFLKSLIYVLGMATTYAGLGVLAARTGQLFGSFMAHPLVMALLSLIFLAMGLSLWGLFEIRGPRVLDQLKSPTPSPRGGVGIFLLGLASGVVASPCVGPVLVGLLAYIAQTKNSLLGFTLLFTFALGFGILFVALGTLPPGFTKYLAQDVG